MFCVFRCFISITLQVYNLNTNVFLFISLLQRLPCCFKQVKQSQLLQQQQQKQEPQQVSHNAGNTSSHGNGKRQQHRLHRCGA